MRKPNPAISLALTPEVCAVTFTEFLTHNNEEEKLCQVQAVGTWHPSPDPRTRSKWSQCPRDAKERGCLSPACRRTRRLCPTRCSDATRQAASVRGSLKTGSSLATKSTRYHSVTLRDPYLTQILFADFLEVQEKIGSSGRTRTYNPPVNSRMLCH